MGHGGGWVSGNEEEVGQYLCALQKNIEQIFYKSKGSWKYMFLADWEIYCVVNINSYQHQLKFGK